MHKYFFFLFFFSVAIFAQTEDQNSDKKDQIKKNYIKGVQSDNAGLKVSSAYQLGELKAEEAVIPLMKVLKDDKDPSTRIMAAISLYKIGTPKAFYAIEQAIKFDDNTSVQNMCRHLINMKKDTDSKKENK